MELPKRFMYLALYVVICLFKSQNPILHGMV